MEKINEWIDVHIPGYLKNSNTVMVMVVDLNGVIWYVNETYVKNFGFRKEEVYGNSFYTQIHSGDADYVLTAAERCLKSPGKIEKLIIRKPKSGENSYYFSEWEFSAVIDENNTSIGVISIGRLISDTNPLNPLEKDTYFELIDNMTSEAWAFYDKDLRLKVCNQKAIEIVRNVFKIEPVRGDSALMFVEDRNKKQLEQAYTVALEGNTVQLELESSQGLYFIVTLKPIFDSTNNIIGVGHYCLEVTNIRKAQEENKKLSTRLQALISQVNGIVMILDLSGTIRYVSDTFSKFTGFTRDQILNKKFSEFVNPEDLDELSEALTSLKDTNGSIVSVFRSVRADGSYCWSLARGRVIEEGGEKYILALIMNIDELKQKEEIIEQHHMRFQQIAWLQSHEVRAPLARILGLVEAINENMVDNTIELKVFLGHIRSAAHELDRVIHKIVSITNIPKSGK